MTDHQNTPPHPRTNQMPTQAPRSASKPSRVKRLLTRKTSGWGVVEWSIFIVLLGMGVATGLSIGLWRIFRVGAPWTVTGRGKVEGIDLVKLALSVVAGSGGAVALTVSVLKQRILEKDEEGERAREQLALAHRQAEADLEKTARDEERARQESYRSRYGEAATQLGSDRAAVQLAGVYAMANLADDWPEQRQQCVDVLCGFLRLPPPTDETLHASDAKVRTAIGAVFRNHLQEGAPWCSLDFNLTGAYLVDLNLDQVEFAGKITMFTGAQFTGKTTSFHGAKFTGKTTSFHGATFTGKTTSFHGATFTGKTTSFHGAKFTSHETIFTQAKFAGHETFFNHALFTGETTSFNQAEFTNTNTWFNEARFNSETTLFSCAQFGGMIATFAGVHFNSTKVSFSMSQFTAMTTSFSKALFPGPETAFKGAQFSSQTISFDEALFANERVDVFRGVTGAEKALNVARFGMESSAHVPVL